MALMLECICSPNASVCILTSLVWNVQITSLHVGTIGAINYLTLASSDGALVSLIDPGSGDYLFDLPLSSTVDAWDSLYVSLFMDASLFQVPHPLYSQFHTFNAGYSIDQHYKCQNLVTGQTSTSVVTAKTQLVGGLVKCQTGEDIRGLVEGGISSTFYKSTPLGACLSGGIGVSDVSFYPKPDHNTVNIADSAQICLCATGGSGNYTYSLIDGTLPCGVALNTDTGCLEGDANGDCPGSTSVTFRVTDLGGSGPGSTGGEVIGGSCRVFGTGATRITGGAWFAEMVGNPIAINGVSYTVATVSPPNNLTTTSTIGIIDPTTWSYTAPIVPPPPPGPPETADVTCGFISKCPDADSSIGGNSAY